MVKFVPSISPMALVKPYKRTCRPDLKGNYGNVAGYLFHRDYAQDPRHYIRAFAIIQKDLLNLFEYVEPSDQNLKTYSFRIHELLIRTCIEVEANCSAILRENIYTKEGHLKMKDYRIIDKTHRLSSYKVALPIWNGKGNVRTPFKQWETGDILDWYDAYNKSKHNRHDNFKFATLDNLLDAVGGLTIILTSQFLDEDYSPNEAGRAISAGTYMESDGMETALGEYFRISFPKNWTLDECYGITWDNWDNNTCDVDKINYDNLMKEHYPTKKNRS